MVVFAVNDIRILSSGFIKLGDIFLLIDVLAGMLTLAGIVQELYLQANLTTDRKKGGGREDLSQRKCCTMHHFSTLIVKGTYSHLSLISNKKTVCSFCVLSILNTKGNRQYASVPKRSPQ